MLGTISEGNSKRLKSYYNVAEQRRITYALSNIRMTESRIKASQNAADDASRDAAKARSRRNSVVYSWLGNLALSCVSFFTGDKVFAVENMAFASAQAHEDWEKQDARLERAEREHRRATEQVEHERVRLSNLQAEMKQDEAMLKEELRNSMWRLERQDLADCNALQERLLQSSWNLLRQYRLPDEYRLTQTSLKNFYRAVQEEDVTRRSRMLCNLEDEFRVYPPYWYYRAKTAQEAGSLTEARQHFAKFSEVWRPVLRRDPYKLEAAKFRIQELVSAGKDLDDIKPELLSLLETVYTNTPKDDWADNLFLGVAYFLLGEKNKGMDCIAVNLDFGYEEKISGMLFAQMEKGSLDSGEAQEVVHRMKLSDLITSMNIADGESAMALSLYFEGNTEALEALSKTSGNPIVFHALRLMEQSKGGGQDYGRVLEFLGRHEALKDKVQGAYTEILPLVRKYSDEGRESARVLLADMLMYGLGVEQDVKTAREMFGALAEGGNVYAQFVMIQGRLAPVEQAPAKPNLTPAQRVIQAAEAGNAEAQFQLGKMYKYGEGVGQDIQKARYWWEKAAAQGHRLARQALQILPAAQAPMSTLTREQIEDLYRTGAKYYNGQGVAMDKTKAVEYLTQAAEAGHSEAQYLLGVCYRFGHGVNQDIQKARYWYGKAAAHGHPYARSALRNLD
ncbi:MAG: sel1 repeat family protein [Synergistaceae bacterium]|nr:sel1 repeat family protein [Synergistaceae bacterium]